MPPLKKKLKGQIVKQEKEAAEIQEKRNSSREYPSMGENQEICITEALNGWTIRSGYDKKPILATSKEGVLEAVGTLLDLFED